MGNKWNDNWLEDARDVGLTTLGKAGLIGVALGTLVFGAYAACKGERAALDSLNPAIPYLIRLSEYGEVTLEVFLAALFPDLCVFHF